MSSILQIDQFKIDLPIVAAFLTLIGFSVNDTIVIFDRIREIKGKTPVLTDKMVNDALNQTLSRTILTSFTAWLVVVILFFFGGEGLHGFAFALVVGFLSGTYSTVYIATPILIDWVRTKPSTVRGGGGKQLAARNGSAVSAHGMSFEHVACVWPCLLSIALGCSWSSAAGGVGGRHLRARPALQSARARHLSLDVRAARRTSRSSRPRSIPGWRRSTRRARGRTSKGS